MQKFEIREYSPERIMLTKRGAWIAAYTGAAGMDLIRTHGNNAVALPIEPTASYEEAEALLRRTNPGCEVVHG